MPKIKRTHEQFLKEMESINPYVIIKSEYITRKQKVKCECKKDGCEWYAIPDSLLRGHGCPKCGEINRRKNNTKKHEKFISELKAILPNVEVLSKYETAKSDIKCRCKIDGYEWEARPNNLLNNHGCPKCAIESRIIQQVKPHAEFLERVSKSNSNIEVLSEYLGFSKKVKCRCKIDNYIWNAHPSTLLNGGGCPKCAKCIKTHEDFIREMAEINPDIEILGKYKTSKDKIRCKCKIDGREWEAAPNNLSNGHGCPRCNLSKGESIVKKYCDKNNIKHEMQYRNSKCKYKQRLLFDFAIFNKEKLLCLIEYQGIQHYKPVTCFGGEKAFIKNQKRDEIKRKFCEENNITLIEIPYWEKDIEEFLETKLNELGSIQLSLI